MKVDLLKHFNAWYLWTWRGGFWK